MRLRDSSRVTVWIRGIRDQARDVNKKTTSYVSGRRLVDTTNKNEMRTPSLQRLRMYARTLATTNARGHLHMQTRVDTPQACWSSSCQPDDATRGLVPSM